MTFTVLQESLICKSVKQIRNPATHAALFMKFIFKLGLHAVPDLGLFNEHIIYYITLYYIL